ncbi:MAG: amidohydrolase family protein [Micrococcaceae bacterium]
MEPTSDRQIPAWLESLNIPGIVDLHVHFMPENVLRKVWQYFDAVDRPGVPPWTITYRTDETERVRTLRQLGVKHFGTLNYAHRTGMARWLNEYSTRFAAQHPDAIHSATFFPEPDVVEVVDRALDDGARLFKLHVQVGGFSPTDPLLDPVWQRLAEEAIPVVVHCGHGPNRGQFTGIDPVREVLRQHPELTLVIAHAGLPDYGSFLQLVRQYPRVYLDTTMVGTDFMETIAPLPPDFPDQIATVADRIVLGTDFPNIPYPYAHQLQVINRWGLGRDVLADVLWHTPRRLVGLEDSVSGTGV